MDPLHFQGKMKRIRTPLQGTLFHGKARISTKDCACFCKYRFFFSLPCRECTIKYLKKGQAYVNKSIFEKFLSKIEKVIQKFENFFNPQ